LLFVLSKLLSAPAGWGWFQARANRFARHACGNEPASNLLDYSKYYLTKHFRLFSLGNPIEKRGGKAYRILSLKANPVLIFAAPSG